MSKSDETERCELVLPDGATFCAPDYYDVCKMAEWYVGTTDDSVTGWGRTFDSEE